MSAHTVIVCCEVFDWYAMTVAYISIIWCQTALMGRQHALGSFAEFERNILRERQREGIEKAKAAGKYAHGKGGRKKSVDRVKVRTLREQGVPFRKIAEQLGCSLSSVQRVIYGEAQ